MLPFLCESWALPPMRPLRPTWHRGVSGFRASVPSNLNHGVKGTLSPCSAETTRRTIGQAKARRAKTAHVGFLDLSPEIRMQIYEL
jgi:hypothetical protein